MVLVDPQSPPSYASALSMSNVKVSPPTTPEKLSHGGAPTLSPSTTTSSIYTVEQPHAEEQPTAFCVPGSGSLEGWLHKKHAHAKMLGSQWAKRCAPPTAAPPKGRSGRADRRRQRSSAPPSHREYRRWRSHATISAAPAARLGLGHPCAPRVPVRRQVRLHPRGAGAADHLEKARQDEALLA
jgi:hypothetical protein